MIVILRLLALAALIYAAWVVFRVVDDWLGMIPAIVSVVLLPISIPALAVVMLFVDSSVAGGIALWPPIVAIGFLDWLARKRNESLLISPRR